MWASLAPTSQMQVTLIVSHTHSSPWQLPLKDLRLSRKYSDSCCSICCDVMGPRVSPLKSTHDIISRQLPMTSIIWGELTLKIALMCLLLSCGWYQTKHLQYILMIFWITVSIAAWKGYIIQSALPLIWNPFRPNNELCPALLRCQR